MISLNKNPKYRIQLRVVRFKYLRILYLTKKYLKNNLQSVQYVLFLKTIVIEVLIFFSLLSTHLSYEKLGVIFEYHQTILTIRWL